MTEDVIVSGDKLDIIFQLQDQLNTALGRPTANLKPERERPQFIKDMVLAATDELHEVMHLFPWKPWKTYKFPEDFHPTSEKWDEIKCEIVDVLHFVIALAQGAGMTADEIFEIYRKKNQENFNRIKTGYAKSVQT